MVNLLVRFQWLACGPGVGAPTTRAYYHQFILIWQLLFKKNYYHMLATDKIFPVVILCTSGFGLLAPQLFLWAKPHIPVFLGIIMFAIGLTLEAGDFKQTWNLRAQIVIIIILKYALLPMVAFCLAKLFGLTTEQYLGLLIVASCPGGTAAAVMTYLARANTALTVVLTFLSTIISPLMTPLLIFLFVHQEIIVPWQNMMNTIFWVMFFPLMDGLILRKIIGTKIGAIKSFLPILAMLCIAIIIGCVIALNRQMLLALPVAAGAAVLSTHLCGLILGYLIAKYIFCWHKSNCQATAFEFGMQDSGMAVMLATKFFSNAVALCASLYSLIQNLLGPIVARYFSMHNNKVGSAYPFSRKRKKG